MKQMTAGEVAKLFNLSKYTIRHYIDKGILTPKRNEENQYYLFEEADIYRLYQINTLRAIGFSIKEIKENLALDTIPFMFEQAEMNVQHEIDRLIETKKTIRKIVHAQKQYALHETIFIEREERYYKKAMEQLIENDAIDYAKVVQYDISNVEEPYFVLFENQPATLCFQSTKEDSTYTLPSGTYACKSFVVTNEDDIEKEVALFLNTFHCNATDTVLLYENIYCSLAYNNKMVYSVEVKR